MDLIWIGPGWWEQKSQYLGPSRKVVRDLVPIPLIIQDCRCGQVDYPELTSGALGEVENRYIQGNLVRK